MSKVIIADPKQLLAYEEFNFYKEARRFTEMFKLLPPEFFLMYDQFENQLVTNPMEEDDPWDPEVSTRYGLRNECIGKASEIYAMSYVNYFTKGTCTKTFTQDEEHALGIDFYLPPNQYGNCVPAQVKTTWYDARRDTFYIFDKWLEKTGALRFFLVDPRNSYMIMADYGRLVNIIDGWTQRANYPGKHGVDIKYFDIPGSMIRSPNRIIDLKEFIEKVSRNEPL